MRLSLPAMFHAAAVAFFVLVLVFEENAFELLAIGMACIAAGLLAREFASNPERARDLTTP